MSKRFTTRPVTDFGVIGVVYGGWSNEREVSVKSGKSMLASCQRLGLEVRGFDLKGPEDVFALANADVHIYLLALHGGAGEDGHVQAAMDLMGLKYSGSGMHSSALCMNKVSSRLACKTVGVPVMPWQSFDSNDIPKQLDFEFPICLKPVSGGSSIGVKKVVDAKSWQQAITNLEAGEWMIEPWYEGVDHFGGILLGQSLPVLEVALPEGQFFDYNNKYSVGNDQLYNFVECPQVQAWTQDAFVALKCQDYARADFITVNGRSWFLEMNTLPGMAPTSLLPSQAAAAGITYDDLLLNLLSAKLSEEPVCV